MLKLAIIPFIVLAIAAVGARFIRREKISPEDQHREDESWWAIK